MTGKIKLAALAATMLTFAAQPALAQDDEGAASVGLTAGTLGIGPEVGYRVNKTIGVRANLSLLSFGADFDSDDVAYRGDIDLKSGGLMLDVYPFGGGFRVSAGARINGNKGELKATPSGATIDIGEDTYTAAEIGTLSGKAEVKDFAPALTLGYGGGLRRGLAFTLEAGVLFQGAVRIKEFTSTGTLANDAAFRADLERERRSLQDDVDDYKVYPILQAGLKYRF